MKRKVYFIQLLACFSLCLTAQDLVYYKYDYLSIGDSSYQKLLLKDSLTWEIEYYFGRKSIGQNIQKTHDGQVVSSKVFSHDTLNKPRNKSEFTYFADDSIIVADFSISVNSISDRREVGDGIVSSYFLDFSLFESYFINGGIRRTVERIDTGFVKLKLYNSDADWMLTAYLREQNSDGYSFHIWNVTDYFFIVDNYGNRCHVELNFGELKNISFDQYSKPEDCAVRKIIFAPGSYD